MPLPRAASGPKRTHCSSGGKYIPGERYIKCHHLGHSVEWSGASCFTFFLFFIVSLCSECADGSVCDSACCWVWGEVRYDWGHLGWEGGGVIGPSTEERVRVCAAFCKDNILCTRVERVEKPLVGHGKAVERSGEACYDRFNFDF